VTACSDTDHSCDQYSKCNIRDPLWRIKDRIVSALAATSVSELAADMTLMPPPGAMPVLVLRK
jgi:DNA-binding IscR family transcriptional regulator